MMKKKMQAVFQIVTFISVMFFMSGLISALLRFIPFNVEFLYCNNCTTIFIGFGIAYLNKMICFGGSK